MVEWNSLFNKKNDDITLILNKLEYKNIINSYPPIYDIEGSIVAQHEHTIYVTDKGVLNMTKNKNYWFIILKKMIHNFLLFFYYNI